MSDINSYDFQDVYDNLGISIPKLGCVMLDVSPIIVTDYIDGGEEDLYVSQNPSRFWIRGAVGEKTPHVTLLYGLLENALEWSWEISRVLDGWNKPNVEIEKIGYFDSTFEDEPYYCIVGHVKKTPELLEAHQRLSLLPHVNTFLEYRPHVTLAYIKKDDKVRDKWVNELSYWLEDVSFPPIALNLGSPK